MNLAFIFLGAAIACVWLPNLHWGVRQFPLWPGIFALAVIQGVVSGLLAPPALASLLALSYLAWYATSARRGAPIATVLAAMLALAMSVHLLPGYRNPKLFSGEHLTADSQAFTAYLNFDKGSAGLFLLAAFAPRLRGAGAWMKAIPLTLLACAGTAIVSIGMAVAAHYTAYEPKLPVLALAFLASNFFFTCVPEEAFFRGLIQERLHCLAEKRFPRSAVWGPVFISAILFGLAHVAAGPKLMVFAFVAGLGYATVYARTRSIEPSIVTHFFVNAVQFLGFAYPALALAH